MASRLLTALLLPASYFLYSSLMKYYSDSYHIYLLTTAHHHYHPHSPPQVGNQTLTVVRTQDTQMLERHMQQQQAR